SAIPEQLPQVGGGAGSVGVVGVTLVDPLVHLGGDVDGLGAVDVGAHAILEDNLHAVVLEQHLIVPVVPAAEHCTIALSCAIFVEEGGLFQEGIHLVEGPGHFNAFCFSGGLVVEHDLGGNKVGQYDLLAFVAGGQNQTFAEVLNGEVVSFDIRIQDLVDTCRTVAGRIGCVRCTEGRYIACGDGCDELGVDFGVATDVDRLHGDQGMLLVEAVDHVLQIGVPLIFVGMPPGNGDGFCNVIGVICSRQTDNGQRHQQSKQYT